MSDINELQKKIRELFEAINNDDIDNWKHQSIDLNEISNSKHNPFSSDARNGFNYLYHVVFNTICDKCNDRKAFVWREKFAKAWLDNTELPKFPTSCWFSEGMYSSEDNSDDEPTK